MPWAVAAAAVTVGGAVYQSSQASKAAKSAQNLQRDSQAQLRSDLLPYMETGQNALMQVGDLSGANGQEAATNALGNFQTSPGYQFRMDQGLRAVDASASSRGMLRSGAQIKAAQEFGQGLASQEFGQYYNRLLGLTQIGQNSAVGVGAQGNQTAAGMAQTAVSAGGAQASIYGQAAQGLGNQANNYANNSAYTQQRNQLMSGGGEGGFDYTSQKAAASYGTMDPSGYAQ